ncbi:MAG: hypothetical protein IPM82_13025 [Saprospiraceae bacterium]|nr:hypothetical protein [Saprospiraceae bacterium]
MKAFRILFFFGWALTSTTPMLAQEEENSPRLQFGGYLKNLQSLTNLPESDLTLTDGQFHNRLNFKWFPSKNFTFDAELRSRFFYGETVKYTPSFERMLNDDPDLVDLSWVLTSSNGTLLHTTLDRFWVEWRNERWVVRTGRQRINWGIATTWNPNDLFNAYNFLDFDYEERPGSDAIRVQYLTSGFSGFDLAVNPADSAEASVAALKYFFNFKKYDLQVLGGYFKNDLVAGMGWAGNLGEAGFKGEASWFHSSDTWKDTNTVITITAQADYLFEGDWYVNGSLLFNSGGQSEAVSLSQLLAFRLSPKNLMPGKYTIAAQAQKGVTPILNVGGSVIFPSNQPAFVAPQPQLFPQRQLEPGPHRASIFCRKRPRRICQPRQPRLPASKMELLNRNSKPHSI